MTALLTAPSEVSAEEIKNAALFDVIRQYGPEAAPIYGWIKGVLPLLDMKKRSFIYQEDNEYLDAYSLLSRAEMARWKGSHLESSIYRNKLKECAPLIYDVYMDYLEGRLL